ncbi:MAG TPA: hypothetical protein VH395_06930 [Jatrophihabitantaceae bacterium]
MTIAGGEGSRVVGDQHAAEIVVQLLPPPLGDRVEQVIRKPARSPVQCGQLPPSTARQRDDLPPPIRLVGLTPDETRGFKVVDRGSDVAGIQIEAAGQFQLRCRALVDRGEHGHVTQAHAALGEAVVEFSLRDLRRLGEQVRRQGREPLRTVSKLRHPSMIGQPQ